MTVVPEPNSVQYACRETCKALGVGFLAEELGVNDATIRNWCNPNTNKVPNAVHLRAMDRLLKAAKRPPFNTIAQAQSIGDRSNDPIGRLAELQRDLDVTVRVIKATDLTDEDVIKIRRADVEIRKQINELLDNILDRDEKRLGAGRSLVDHPPTRLLRPVVGGRP